MQDLAMGAGGGVGVVLAYAGLQALLRRNGRNGTHRELTRIQEQIRRGGEKSEELHVKTLEALNKIATHVEMQTQAIEHLAKRQDEIWAEMVYVRRPST